MTEHGELIAHIIAPAPTPSRLANEGQLRRAIRPGYRPRMRAGDGTDRLTDAVATLRDEDQ